MAGAAPGSIRMWSKGGRAQRGLGLRGRVDDWGAGWVGGWLEGWECFKSLRQRRPGQKRSRSGRQERKRERRTRGGDEEERREEEVEEEGSSRRNKSAKLLGGQLRSLTGSSSCQNLVQGRGAAGLKITGASVWWPSSEGSVVSLAPSVL